MRYESTLMLVWTIMGTERWNIRGMFNQKHPASFLSHSLRWYERKRGGDQLMQIKWDLRRRHLLQRFHHFSCMWIVNVLLSLIVVLISVSSPHQSIKGKNFKSIKNYDSFCFFAHKNIFDVHSTCNPVLKNGYFNEHSNTKVGGLLQERPLHTYSESQGQEVWPVQQIPFASQVYPG